MAIPIIPIIQRYLDDPDIPSFCSKKHTHDRAPQLEQILARSRHCGCKCGMSRGTSVASSDTAVNSTSDGDQEWDMFDDDLRDQDYDGSTDNGAEDLHISIHSEPSSPTILFPPQFALGEYDDHELAGSMEALASSRSVSSLSIANTPHESMILDTSMAESDSVSPLQGSELFHHAIGGIVDTTALPTRLDYDFD